MTEQINRHLQNYRIHLLEQSQTAFGDLRPDNAPVVTVTLLTHELEGLEAGKQTRDVRVGGDHAVADGGAGEAVGMGAAQDAQNVVLRGGDAPVAGFAMEGAMQAVGGAKQI